MLRLRDMIRLLADQNLAPLAGAMIDHPNQRRWLLARTGKRLGLDNRDRSGVAVASIMPRFFRRRRDLIGSCRHPSLDPSAVPSPRPAGHSRRSRATLPALVAARAGAACHIGESIEAAVVREVELFPEPRSCAPDL